MWKSECLRVGKIILPRILIWELGWQKAVLKHTAMMMKLVSHWDASNQIIIAPDAETRDERGYTATRCTIRKRCMLERRRVLYIIQFPVVGRLGGMLESLPHFLH